MVISRELRRLVQTGARAEALQATALAEGMRTLRQDGIEKVLAGVTSIEEVRVDVEQLGVWAAEGKSLTAVDG